MSGVPIKAAFVALSAIPVASLAVMAPAQHPGAGSPAANVEASNLTAAQRNPACAAAAHYIDLINTGQFSRIGDVFADQVDYVGPDGATRSTRPQVVSVYEAMGAAYRKEPGRARVTRLSPVGRDQCFLEFSLFDYKKQAFRLAAVDHFIVDNRGKVIWFRPFFQQPYAGLLVARQSRAER